MKTSFGQIQETTIQSGKLNFTVPFVQSIHTVNNKQQDKHIKAQIWGEASDKTPVYAADVIVTYQVLPERSAWLYANVSDTKNLVGDELVASAIKSAMAELGPNEVTNRISRLSLWPSRSWRNPWTRSTARMQCSSAADAQAEANRKIAESLSDTLIEYQKIQKWDGKLPTVSGGNALVSIDPTE